MSGNINKLATRHLYHGPTGDSAGVLLHTLRTRPDLAKHVRQLSTGKWGTSSASMHYLDGFWISLSLQRAMHKCSRLEELHCLGHILFGLAGSLKVATLRGLGAGGSSIAPWYIESLFTTATGLETLVVYRLGEREYDD